MTRGFRWTWTLVATLAAFVTPNVAEDLAKYCPAWAAQCAPGFGCPPPAGTSVDNGAWGLEVSIDQGAPGCSLTDGYLGISNVNGGVDVEIAWHSTTGTLFFEAPASCGAGECSCLGSTCPGPGPGLGGCDYLDDCDDCGCEIGPGTAVTLAAGASTGAGCALPGSDEQPCDNSECPTYSQPYDPFCTVLSDDTPLRGFTVEITRLSFDAGGCWYEPASPLVVPYRRLNLTAGATLPPGSECSNSPPEFP